MTWWVRPRWRGRSACRMLSLRPSRCAGTAWTAGSFSPRPPSAGLALASASPPRPPPAGRDQHGAVPVSQELAGAVRPGPECPGTGVGDVVGVGVVDVDGPAPQFGVYAEGGGVDAPQDLVGMVVPGEG